MLLTRFFSFTYDMVCVSKIRAFFYLTCAARQWNQHTHTHTRCLVMRSTGFQSLKLYNLAAQLWVKHNKNPEKISQMCNVLELLGCLILRFFVTVYVILWNQTLLFTVDVIVWHCSIHDTLFHPITYLLGYFVFWWISTTALFTTSCCCSTTHVTVMSGKSLHISFCDFSRTSCKYWFKSSIFVW
jgi:hypothetical protein